MPENETLPPSPARKPHHGCSNSLATATFSTISARKPSPRLPSWVPDWSGDVDTLSSIHLYFTGMNTLIGREYCAGGDTISEPDCSTDNTKLTVNAAMIDTLTTLRTFISVMMMLNTHNGLIGSPALSQLGEDTGSILSLLTGGHYLL